MDSVIKILNFKVVHVSVCLLSSLQLKVLALVADQQYKDAQPARTILFQQLQPAQHVILMDTIKMQEFVKNAHNCVANVLDLLLVLSAKHLLLILLLIMEHVFATLCQIYS